MFTDIKDAPKDKAKGCVNFIGELYNCNLLPNKIIYYCFNELLSMHESNIFEKIIAISSENDYHYDYHYH